MGPKLHDEAEGNGNPAVCEVPRWLEEKSGTVEFGNPAICEVPKFEDWVLPSPTFEKMGPEKGTKDNELDELEEIEIDGPEIEELCPPIVE